MKLELYSGDNATAVRCALCGLGEREVGDLVGGRRDDGTELAICGDCLSRCRDLLDAAGERALAEESADEEPTATVPTGPVRCLLCFLPKDAQEVTVIPGRGPLCAVCIEAVRTATD